MGCPLSFLVRAWVNFGGCFFEEVNPGNKDEANKWSKDFNANICRSNFFFFTLDGSPSLIYNFGDKLTANILARLFAILLAALATTFFTYWSSPFITKNDGIFLSIDTALFKCPKRNVTWHDLQWTQIDLRKAFSSRSYEKACQKANKTASFWRGAFCRRFQIVMRIRHNFSPSLDLLTLETHRNTSLNVQIESRASNSQAINRWRSGHFVIRDDKLRWIIAIVFPESMRGVRFWHLCYHKKVELRSKEGWRGVSVTELLFSVPDNPWSIEFNQSRGWRYMPSKSYKIFWKK